MKFRTLWVVGMLALAFTSCDKLKGVVGGEECPQGQHKSAGHCCPLGEDWVPAKEACVCLDPKGCEAMAKVQAQAPVSEGDSKGGQVGVVVEPGKTGKPADQGLAVNADLGKADGQDEPAKPVEEKPALPVCVGKWSGILEYTSDHGDNYKGKGEVEIGSAGKRCGSSSERWSDGGGCSFRLEGCRFKGDRLNAVAVATKGENCVKRTKLELKCSKKKASYLRPEAGFKAYGTVERR